MSKQSRILNKTTGIAATAAIVIYAGSSIIDNIMPDATIASAITTFVFVLIVILIFFSYINKYKK
jgi:hypothetical protein